jgi:hypothetical protein
MFTLGQSYEFTLFANGRHHSHVGRVVEIAMPLVKFRDPLAAEAIINVHSAAFVGAKVADETLRRA